MLCDGMAIHAVARITGRSKNTITKLVVDAGRITSNYQDKILCNLNSHRIQVDEIWSFGYTKQKNVPKATRTLDRAINIWTWTAIDTDSKLVISWLVGGRDSEYAMAFMDDLIPRLATKVQLANDGHKTYLEAVEGAFDADVDYAQLVKLYDKTKVLESSSNISDVSTSYVKRQSLTTRMHMRRFTRLTNGFSKKIEKHAHAVALHFMYYNFCRTHKNLRVSPAMEAGVTDKLWDMMDVVALIEVEEAKKPRERGHYTKRTA